MQRPSTGFRSSCTHGPGYGGSTPAPGRIVAGAAADVAAILDHLGARQFLTVGWSGGGPHALIGEFSTALEGQDALNVLLQQIAPLMQGLTADVLADNIGDLASPPDKQALRGEPAEYVAASFRAGLRPGIAGWRDDDLAFLPQEPGV
jgi:pimeloyl-ACP methyl ester carboxylesterase